LAIFPCLFYRLTFKQTLGKNGPGQAFFDISICYYEYKMESSGGSGGMSTGKMAIIFLI
jgi:hypothetical protein